MPHNRSCDHAAVCVSEARDVPCARTHRVVRLGHPSRQARNGGERQSAASLAELIGITVHHLAQGGHIFQGEMRGRATGTTVIGLRQPALLSCEVVLPNPDTQRRIASTLQRIDEKMDVNRRANGYLAELCEAIAGAMDVDGTTTLADIATQATVKVACEESTIESYVSTESFLPNKGGRQIASSLPIAGRVTVYQPGATLVSNIRPYFKKVWYADCEGTCSGDVIVFRANEPKLAPCLYSMLRSDGFFEHVMAGAKGTKMPRGDKKQMMQSPVANDCDEEGLGILASLLNQTSINNRESVRLSDLRDALLPKLMSGEIDASTISAEKLVV